MRELIIGKNDAGQRLDKFLQKTLKNLPPPLMYRHIRQKNIRINRTKADGAAILREGDTVQLWRCDGFFPDSSEGGSQENAFMKLTPRIHIVYEDENIILCDKKAGMLAHSDEEQGSDTLIDHIKAYLYQKGEYDPEKEQSFAPALCNRIDRNTSGIVIAAKNAQALREMNDKIKNGKVDKRYLCAVHGRMEKESDILRSYMIKDPSSNLVRVYDSKPRSDSAKEAITEYRVMRYNSEKDLSLLEVRLHTGRTHQIRAQFSHLSHPLLGDGKYGVNRDDKKSGYKFQALYSYKLSFLSDPDSDVLAYLSNKTFSIPEANIWFLQEFGE